MERQDDGVGRRPGHGVVPLVNRSNAQGRMKAEGLARGAHLVLWRHDDDLPQRLQAPLEGFEALGFDAIVIGNQDAFCLHGGQPEKEIGARGFEPPTSWSRIEKSMLAQKGESLPRKRVYAARMCVSVRVLLNCSFAPTRAYESSY